MLAEKIYKVQKELEEKRKVRQQQQPASIGQPSVAPGGPPSNMSAFNGTSSRPIQAVLDPVGV